MKKTFTRLFLFFFLTGVIGGPGYLLYCSHFSGKPVAEHDLFSLDISPISVAGVTSRNVKGEEVPIPPLSLQLDPAMNPIAVLVTGHYVPPLAGRPGTSYRVRMLRTKTILWEDTVQVSGRTRSKKEKPSLGDVKIGRMGLDAFSFHVRSFSVSEPGVYDVLVTRAGHAALHVVDMKIKIRRNVKVANTSIVIAGCVALGIGLLGLMAIGIINKKASIK